jgi:dihydrofolate reductase
VIRASVFVGVSVDGFLARRDGALDFLPEDAEDHGYAEFFASVDALVIGRKTHETVLAFPDWPYGDKPVFMLSSSPTSDVRVERLQGEPRAILDALAERGFAHVYVDGGETIQRFLRAGAIDRLVVTRVPVLIGEGIPLFGPLAGDVKLRHVATRAFPSGLVQSEYVLDSRA